MDCDSVPNYATASEVRRKVLPPGAVSSDRTWPLLMSGLVTCSLAYCGIGVTEAP